MSNELINGDCRLSGTPYCALLNMKSCNKCYVSKLSPEQQLEAAEDIFYVADALPVDGVLGITERSECTLCRSAGRDSEPNEATRFAQIDMAHEHPLEGVDEKHDRRYNRSVSMLIPVQLPVCDECRSRLNKMYYLPLALGILVAFIGLVVTSLEPVRLPLAKYGRVLPFLVFLIFVFLGVIVESVVKRSMRVRVERSMNTRAKRITALSELIRNGWFALANSDGMLPFVFTKDPLDSGIVTGENQLELLEEIRRRGLAGVKALEENDPAPKSASHEPEDEGEKE